MAKKPVLEALHSQTALEVHLDKIEAALAFQKMMRNSARAIREGRVTSHEQVVRMSRSLGKRNSKKRR